VNEGKFGGYFLFMYENRTMKPVKTVLRRERGKWEELWRGVNLIKINCKHICNYHNVSPLYNYYMLIKSFKNCMLWAPFFPIAIIYVCPFSVLPPRSLPLGQYLLTRLTALP
jgi:hypothetical protein